MHWTITYRAVLRDSLPQERASALRAQLDDLASGSPGRLVQVPDACAGTLLAGELAVSDDYSFPDVERLLMRLSELERHFPEVRVEAHDSLGLVGRDPGTDRLNLCASVADGVLGVDDLPDPFDVAVDTILGGEEPWPMDELDQTPFANSMWEAYDLREPRRLPCRQLTASGAGWSGDIAIDAREDTSGSGVVLLVHGDITLLDDGERAHVVSTEVIVRDGDGHMLATYRTIRGQDVRRRMEVHLEVGLGADEASAIATIEVWVDSYVRRRRILASWTPDERLTPGDVSVLDAQLRLSHVTWPVPGLKLAGDVTNLTDKLMTCVDVAFIARDRQNRILDDDEIALGVLTPGESRPLSLQLSWDYDADNSIGGAVHGHIVTRVRDQAWLGRVVKLDLL